MALNIDIVTPERKFYSGPADEVRAPGVNGEFGILPDHTLFLSLLRGGVVTVTSGASRKRFVIGRGFAEAGPERVVILTDLCQPAEAVDKAEAQQDLARAEAVLADSVPDSPERLAAERDVELSRARLDV